MNRRLAVLLVFLIGLWGWVVWTCALAWARFPAYAYGWLVPVLMLFFVWRRWGEPYDPKDETPSNRVVGQGQTLAWGGAALLALPVDLLLGSWYASRLGLWILALGTVAMTLWAARKAGGRSCFRAVCFPAVFFLSAVPWPSRLETPITLDLMKSVTAVTTEVLHWMGVQAMAHGTTIAMRYGRLGIEEACSGIRSLEAGIMFSLAAGEYFRLKVTRRMVTVLLCLPLAFLLNSGRTLFLALQMDRGGKEAVEQWHASVGHWEALALPVLLVLCASLLSRKWDRRAVSGVGGNPTDGRGGNPPTAFVGTRRARAAALFRSGGALPDFRLALAVLILSWIGCAWWWRHEQNVLQRAPLFHARLGPGSGVASLEVPGPVNDLLEPTFAEYLRWEPSPATQPAVFAYHFFWSSFEENPQALWHRPDVCLPAGGWRQDAPVKLIRIPLGRRQLTWYLFSFRQGASRALQLWGVWLNGRRVEMRFDDPWSGNGPTFFWGLRHGKSRGAIEVVSLFWLYRTAKPDKESIERALHRLFDYHLPTREMIPGRGKLRKTTSVQAFGKPFLSRTRLFK